MASLGVQMSATLPQQVALTAFRIQVSACVWVILVPNLTHLAGDL